MNKWKYIIFMMSLLLCACSSKAISLDEAKKVALNDASLTEGEVNFSKEYQDDDGYVFEFSNDEKKYSYTIKSDGSVGSRDYNSIEDHSQTTQDDTSIDPNKDTSQNNTRNTTISEDNAKDIALSVFDVTKDQVSQMSVTTVNENDYSLYRVKFYKDAQEYVCDVNKENGEVINKYTQKDDRKVS